MLTIVAVLALVLAYVALVAAYVALRTLAKFRRSAAVLAKGADNPQLSETLLEATSRHIRLTTSVAADVDELRADIVAIKAETAATLEGGLAELTVSREQLDAVMARSLRNVALVRYDAFADMAGRMSFSLALLDDSGDGVTVSAIAGRSDTRVYAKGVRAGGGEHDLSPEEAQAVKAAIRSRSGRPAVGGAGQRRVVRRDRVRRDQRRAS